MLRNSSYSLFPEQPINPYKDTLYGILKKYWGYRTFRPLQEEAVLCPLHKRDSLVVLPTGGGKSICFQAPAMIKEGMAVVVSPLISLMKDQIDSLQGCGIPAARLDSTLSDTERRGVFARMYSGGLKMLYLSPERLASDNFLNRLKELNVSFFAIDEAHCISLWGHDFRPEYRKLGRLKSEFPDISIHAFTATATRQVAEDIVRQLNLAEPEILTGSFFRSNLIYAARLRKDPVRQITEIIGRYPDESGIIYCISRKNVEALCDELTARGYKAAPYHAGMGEIERKTNQEKFIHEQVNIIVATVAFGMGIDKSNVRYVIHSGMPKSIEHYQQESGRAGRDGLEAECVLIYSPADFMIWKSILSGQEPDIFDIQMNKLNSMMNYCTAAACRHARILNYFGQKLENSNCGACDICLGNVKRLDNSLQTSQKIISCIIRLEERFGADYTSKVLGGSKEDRIVNNRHDTLSTFGLLADSPVKDIRGWIEQLVSQGVIYRQKEDNVLKVPKKGWDVIHGLELPVLLAPEEKPKKLPRKKKAAPKKPAAAKRKKSRVSIKDAPKGLFEELRSLRLEIAKKARAPAYQIFNDKSLLEMANRKPLTKSAFLEIPGVGEYKCHRYSKRFITLIQQYISRTG